MLSHVGELWQPCEDGGEQLRIAQRACCAGIGIITDQPPLTN
jgi:hypothetical protein